MSPVRAQSVQKVSAVDVSGGNRTTEAFRPFLQGDTLNGDPSRNPSGLAKTALCQEAMRALETFISRTSYPCLGAKSALARGTLDCFCAEDICDATDDPSVAERVQSFASNAQQDDLFVSLAVLFPGSPPLSEIDFERALWQRLQAIHVIDRVHHGWDRTVSGDPASRHFSMSVGGKGFFVIGLHPGASRRSRRFQCPVMVFNLHSQFETLRADGRYGKLRSAIVARDILFSGSSNPMLATYGERSEARQYSGRSIEENWVCPFAAKDEENPE